MPEPAIPPSTADPPPAARLARAGLAGCGLAVGSALLGAQAGLSPALLAASTGMAGAISAIAILAILSRRSPVAPPVEEASAVAAGAGAGASLPTMLQAALDAAPAPVLIVTQGPSAGVQSGGRILALNAAAQDRFTLAKPGSRVDALIRQPDLVAAIGASLGDGRVRQVPLTSLVPVERFERATIAPFEDGGARFILLTLADETEQRTAERTRADFLANASHELRTPLASIAGFIETLRGPARDDPEARERFLKIMDDQAARMSRLLTDLSSLSRIELFERLAPTGTVDLAEVAREGVELLAAGSPVDLTGADGPVPVTADRDQLVQVLTNLLDNARKYGGGQPVRVRVGSGLDRELAVQAAGRQWPEAHRLPLTSPGQEPNRLYAVLRVEDGGAGIAREELPRLTERFYRVEANARGVPGTGLGLAIVKHIVNRHRGGMLVETRPGAGTSFAVYLPQPAGTAPALQPAPATVQAPPPDGPAGAAALPA